MTPEERRQRASELTARAEAESMPGRRALLLQMAKCWSELAQRAEMPLAHQVEKPQAE